MHDVPVWVSWTPFIAMLIGFVAAWVFYVWKPDLPKKLAERHQALHKFLLNGWYVDRIFNYIFVKPVLKIAQFFRRFDRMIDIFGPNAAAFAVKNIALKIIRIQSGYVYHYAFGMVIGVSILLTWLIFFHF